MTPINLKRRNVFKITSHGFIQMVVTSSMVHGATVENILPTNGTIKQGIISISSHSNTMTINQLSQKGIIEWGTFNIGQNATVNFIQPNSTSSTLNRVINSNPSEIAGKLNANGQIFLINPNGILFSKTSKVDVGSLIASTMNISDENYLNSNYTFQRDGSMGKIINFGELSAKDKGYIALMAPEVINDGVIRATLGNIAIGSGEHIRLSFSEGDLVSMEVSETEISTLIENKNLIITDEGKVFISAHSRDQLLGSMVKSSGIIEANSLRSKNGEIYLESSDTIDVSGTIKAYDGKVVVGNKEVTNTHIQSTAVLEGAFVETSAQNLEVQEGAKISAKTWLLDPTDITIVSSGIDGIGGSTISGATLSTTLNAGTSIVLDATNNITINDNISKTTGTDTTLSFKAGNNITLNSGKSITSDTNKLNLIFWTDSDNTNAGGITFNSASLVTTNGGHIWMGGGSGTTMWNGFSVGNSYARGTGTAYSGGVEMNGATVYTSGGDIKIYGYGPSAGGAGIHLANTTLSTQANSGSTTANGQIQLRGDGYYTSNANGMGLNLDNSSIIGGSSGVLIEGHQSVNNAGQWSIPLFFKSTNPNDPIRIYALGNGALDFNLYSNVAGSQTYNNFMQFDTPNVIIGNSGQNSDITIKAYGISNSGLFMPNVFTGGNLTLDLSNASSIGSGATAGWDTSSPWNTIDVSANELHIGGSTNIIGNTSSTASVRLTHVGNDFVGALSATNIKNLRVSDSNGLSLGNIDVIGTIDISTLSGDLILNGSISTPSISTAAILLNAGKNTSAGISTGGNIIHNAGTITTGTNGRATLYTGSISGSTGLTSLIGSGTGRFRYNSDETSTNYNITAAPLGSGLYAIYREQPTLIVTPSVASNTYSSPVSIAGVTGTIAGYVNGDSSLSTEGTPSFTTTATNTSNAGTYDIAFSTGLINTLGYTILDATSSIGEYTINKAPLTLNVTGATYTYDGTAKILSGYTTSGLVNGENSSVLDSVAITATRTNAGTTTSSTIASDNNYNITVNEADLVINKAHLTVTANDATKTYGENNPTLSTTISGFVNGETLATSGVTGSGSATTTVTASTEVGTATITAGVGNLSASNYDFTNLVNGIFTINPNASVDNALIITEQLSSTKIVNEINANNSVVTPVTIDTDTATIFSSDMDATIDELISQIETEIIVTNNTQINKETNIEQPKVILQDNGVSLNTQINTVASSSINANNDSEMSHPEDQQESLTKAVVASSTTMTSISKNLSTDTFQNTIHEIEQGLINSGMNLEESQMVANAAIKMAISNPNGASAALKEITNALKVDKASVASALSNGNPPKGDATFDHVFQALLAKGVSPQDALRQAQELSQSIPKEPSFSEQVRSISTDQVKIVLNLIAKGYTQSDALKIAASYSFPKESSLSKIASGEQLIDSPMVGKYLSKYSLEEALILAKKTEQEKKLYQTIDQQNSALVFRELSKEGKIPNNKLFDKIFANKLKSHPFEEAYRIALDEYQSLFKNKASPLEKMAQGTIEKSKITSDQIWWKEFIKNIMNGKNQEEAKMFADKAKNLFETKKLMAIKIDEKIQKRGKHE